MQKKSRLSQLTKIFLILAMLSQASCATTQETKNPKNKTAGTKTKFSKHRLLDASLDPSKTNLASDMHSKSTGNFYEKAAAASSADASSRSSSCPTCGP